jgi:hypothetical protein
MKITIDMVMDKRPCSDYSRDRVAALWAGLDALTLADICDLDIPAPDRIWAVTRFLSDRDNRLFACDCAQSVAHLNPDPRVQSAIDTARRYADGEATEEERAAAGAAAGAAAWAAAQDAARDAARDAAWAAARAAAWAAAGAAAGAASCAAGAASCGARDAQIKTLRERCERVEDETDN